MMSVEKITENIFANVAYEGGNVACINTPDGVVLVDTPTLRKDIQDWKAFVLDLNPKGVRYIINTHIHFDHVIGNHKLGGTIVMHEKTGEKLFDEGATLREAMAGMMPGWPKEEVDFILSEPLTPPEIILSKELNMYVGDYTLKLRHIGGHTADSIMVYVVEDRILITGDNLTAARHPYKGEACFSDWIKALQEMKTYDIKTIIPGHGEVCEKDEIDRFIEYFQTLWNKTHELVVKDYSSEDVVKTIQKEMFDFFEVEPEMLEGSKMMFDIGTRQLYEEIKSD
jgi:glyoxylase-like metal-dependent hydrolase (beta-lactamase superfamily II)